MDDLATGTGGDGDALVENCDLHCDPKGDGTFGSQVHADSRLAEALRLKIECVITGRDVVKAEGAGVVSRGLSDRLIIGGEKGPLRFGDSGSRRIKKTSSNDVRSRLVFRDIRHSSAGGTLDGLGTEHR